MTPEPFAKETDLDLIITRLGLGVEFSALPQTFARILKIDPGAEDAFNRYLACLKSEPGVASKVLKVANSAFLGGVAEITNLRSAMVRLGTTTTRSIILSVLVMDMMQQNTELLMHSVACGAFAARVSAAAGIGEPDDFFAAGILHDIGKVFLLLAKPAGKDAAPCGGAAGLAAERARYGVDHTQVGAWLAARWNFPERLRSAIQCHHEPPADAALATRLIAKANEWTRGYYRADPQAVPNTEELIGWMEKNLRLSRARFLEALQFIPEDVAGLTDHFATASMGTREVLRLLQRANLALGEINLRYEFLHRRLTQQLRNLTLLQGLGPEVSACVGQKDMCDKAVELIASRLQIGVVSILVPGPGGKLFVQSAVGLPNEIVGNAGAEAKGNIGRWVFEHGETLLLKHIPSSGDFQPSTYSARYSTGSALSVPIRQSERTLGVLNINNKADGTPFNEEDLQMFEVLANSLGALLHAEQERIKRERSDQRFRSLAAMTPIAMAGFDLSGTVWLWNRAAHGLTDIAPGDAVGSRVPRVLLPSGDEGVLKRWISAVREGRVIEREECVIFLPDGTEGHLLYTVFPLEGKLLGVWTGVNISKEKAAQFRAERRAVEMEATQQVLHEILGDLDERAVMKSFAQRLVQVLSADQSMLFVRDDNTKELTCIAHTGFAEDTDVSAWTPAVVALADKTCRAGEHLILNSPAGATDEIRRFIEEGKIRNLMAAPLHVRHETVGMVCVFNKQVRGFTDDDLHVLRDLASVASVGLRVAEVHAQRVYDEQLRATVGMAVTYNHEINNPLQVILGMAELAAKHPGLPEGVKAALTQIEESAVRIAGVNDRLRKAVSLTFREYLGDLSMIEVPEVSPETPPRRDPSG